jgi:extradiol dioxygenase family protein
LNVVDHIAFNVESIADAVEWYTTKTGASIKYQDETWALLDVGGIQLALTLPGEHPNHFAIRCESINEFPISDKKVGNHRDGSNYIYLVDPYGNAIEWIYYPTKD